MQRKKAKSKMQVQSANLEGRYFAVPNFKNVSTAQLWTVIKRGKYTRFPAAVQAAIDSELAVRRLEERRVN